MSSILITPQVHARLTTVAKSDSVQRRGVLICRWIARELCRVRADGDNNHDEDDEDDDHDDHEAETCKQSGLDDCKEHQKDAHRVSKGECVCVLIGVIFNGEENEIPSSLLGTLPIGLFVGGVFTAGGLSLDKVPESLQELQELQEQPRDICGRVPLDCCRDVSGMWLSLCVALDGSLHARRGDESTLSIIGCFQNGVNPLKIDCLMRVSVTRAMVCSRTGKPLHEQIADFADMLAAPQSCGFVFPHPCARDGGDAPKHVALCASRTRGDPDVTLASLLGDILKVPVEDEEDGYRTPKSAKPVFGKPGGRSKKQRRKRAKAAKAKSVAAALAIADPNASGPRVDGVTEIRSELSSKTIVIDVEVLRDASTSAELHAPVLAFGDVSRVNRVLVTLDVLCYIESPHIAVSDCVERLSEGLARVARAMSRTAARHPIAFHVLPACLGYAFTVFADFAAISNDDRKSNESNVAVLPIQNTRQHLHRLFDLPVDRPLVRQSCALFGSDDRSERKLHNVHLALYPSAIPKDPDTKQWIVQGAYAYHHYMQDEFDDRGWGCAYRTLQSICSWFQLQHYTSKSPPSHVQVQRALVRLGDKKRAFVGSKEWIGAIELSMVLKDLYSVECRTLFVSSGKDIPSHARQLAHHFRQQGTPVMCGGAALAWGILGVEFNELTGAVRFLILDPHYPGEDDLATIVKKGWVAWKNPSVFNQRTFYNFCLPQRPSLI